MTIVQEPKIKIAIGAYAQSRPLAPPSLFNWTALAAHIEARSGADRQTEEGRSRTVSLSPRMHLRSS